jgi:hypothetical protein
MSSQGWVETLVTAQGDGPALNTFTTIVTMLPNAAIYALPANYFDKPGKMLRQRARGRISSGTSGTFTFSTIFGATAVATTPSVWTPGAIVTIVSLTNISFELDIDLTCRSIGSGTAATVLGIGRFTSAILTGGSGGVGTAGGYTQLLPATAPAVGTGFDSTASVYVNLMVSCSVSLAANAITLHTYSLESLN